MKYVGNVQSQANSEVYATASGTLPNGKPVVVNSDGTVSVAAVTSVSQSVGTPAVFESAAINGLRSAYDSNSNRVVITYKDLGNSNYGTCVVGTLNPANNSVSFGTPVVFESHTVSYDNSVVFDSNSNKVVVFYNTNASGSGQAKVGTVDPSDNSITFGSSTQFDNNAPTFIASTFDSNANKVVVAFRDAGQSNAAVARVGTISGTSISFGTQATIASAGDNIGCAFDSTSNKIVFAYRDVGNSNRGTAVVGTVSGTDISFGTPVVFNSGGSIAYCGVAFDSIANKSVIVYADQANSSYGTVIVATVSGTSISFGSAVVFTSSFAVFSTDNGIAYDTSAGKVVIGYRNIGNSNYGTAISGTVSGTSISFDSPLVFKAAEVSDVSTVYDSTSERILIGYKDPPNSNYGTGIVYRPGSASTNLTSENYIGMSSGGVEFESRTQAVGSATVFEAASSTWFASTFDTSNNKVVFSYADAGNSSKGTAIVGTISDTSISFGNAVEFEQGATESHAATFDTNSNKVVLAYRDQGNSNYGTAIVGTVSGTNISFGSAVAFESASSDYIGIAFDSNSNKVVISYVDLGDSNKGKAIVGTVSGTNISFGSATAFEPGATLHTKAVFDSSNNKVVIAYQDDANSDYGTAVVGTVSGTSISFGTPVVFEQGNTSSIGMSFDTTNNKVVIAYKDGSNSNYGTAIVGTVSGTSISFGTAVVYESAASTYNNVTFDPSAQTSIITYQDGGNSAKGTFVVGTISGTSISFTSATTFTGANSSYFLSTTLDSNSNRLANAFYDVNNNNYGTSVILKTAFNSENRGQVASGSTATIQAGGAVNTLQTGLTAGQQYFVQTDGTLGLAADDPSVIAGTAVSATDLIVKG